MVKVEINYQTKVPWKFEALFEKLAHVTVSILKLKSSFYLSVAFVSPITIKRLNKAYRAKDKVTDVLSFEGLNEIVICYQQARQNLKNFGGFKHSVKQEIAFLFIHGFLHLLDYDDQTASKALKMKQLADKILAKVKIIS